MKIRPVILCGGAGTRLWPNQKINIAKQFIDFGGWNLFEKSLIRCKGPLFDYPIISTNIKYLKQIRKFLRKHKVKIIFEPGRSIIGNTGTLVAKVIYIKERKLKNLL